MEDNKKDWLVVEWGIEFFSSAELDKYNCDIEELSRNDFLKRYSLLPSFHVVMAAECHETIDVIIETIKHFKKDAHGVDCLISETMRKNTSPPSFGGGCALIVIRKDELPKLFTRETIHEIIELVQQRKRTKAFPYGGFLQVSFLRPGLCEFFKALECGRDVMKIYSPNDDSEQVKDAVSFLDDTSPQAPAPASESEPKSVTPTGPEEKPKKQRGKKREEMDSKRWKATELIRDLMKNHAHEEPLSQRKIAELINCNRSTLFNKDTENGTMLGMMYKQYRLTTIRFDPQKFISRDNQDYERDQED